MAWLQLTIAFTQDKPTQNTSLQPNSTKNSDTRILQQACFVGGLMLEIALILFACLTGIAHEIIQTKEN